MTYRDRKDEANTNHVMLKDNVPLYHKLQSISRVLVAISIVLVVVAGFLFFFATENTVVTLLFIDCILLLIAGNVIAHYKLLRR